MLVRRLFAASLALGVGAFLAMIGNYGGRQEYAEYRLKNFAVAELSKRGPIDLNDLATIMGIAHKESRFWNGAVGRNHEAGVMQLSETLSASYRLTIAKNVRKSTPVEKLFFLNPSGTDITRDERLDERISMRVAIDHFFGLKRRLKVRYGLDEEHARDLSILAFHLGEANAKRWIECSPDRNLNSVLDALADPALPQGTWFKRAVAVSFSEHVLRYRASFLKGMPSEDSQTAPSMGDVLENILVTPKEFYTRIFKDMPELHRAMNGRNRVHSSQCKIGA